MLLEIKGLLNEAQVEKIREIANRVGFVDGRATAGMAASRVKNNEELTPDPDAVALVNRILMAALGHNPGFRSAALPHRLADFIVARYHPGINSDTYLKRLCEVNLITAATPSMHNDAVVMEALRQFDYPTEDPQDWAAVGCVEPTIAGKHAGHTNFQLIKYIFHSH